MTDYCITVPCKAYVKKYFSALYGEPFPLNLTSDLADTILTKMVTQPIKRLSHHQINQAFLHFNDKIKFQLPADFFYRVENNLNQQQSYAINRYLHNVFESDFFAVVNVAAAFGVERRIAIESFCMKFNITLEEDITYEALKKSEYRLRNSPTMKNNFLATLSSPYRSTVGLKRNSGDKAA